MGRASGLSRVFPKSSRSLPLASSQNQVRGAIAASRAAMAAGLPQLIRSNLCRADAPATISTAERATPAIRATVSSISALALPRSGAAATPITSPRGSTRKIPIREAPGRAITASVTESVPVLSQAGSPSPTALRRTAPCSDWEGTLRAVNHRRRRYGSRRPLHDGPVGGY
jgi:hypothetical protein